MPKEIQTKLSGTGLERDEERRMENLLVIQKLLSPPVLRGNFSVDDVYQYSWAPYGHMGMTDLENIDKM